MKNIDFKVIFLSSEKICEKLGGIKMVWNQEHEKDLLWKSSAVDKEKQEYEIKADAVVMFVRNWGKIKGMHCWSSMVLKWPLMVYKRRTMNMR